MGLELDPTKASQYPTRREVQHELDRLAGIAGALRDPLRILKGNLALWLQADLGTPPVAGASVDPWQNQAGSSLGNAVKDGQTSAPLFVPASFGAKPGVSGTAAGDRGLVATLTPPIPPGSRPYTWLKAKLNSAAGFQPLVAFNDAGFAGFMYIALSAGSWSANMFGSAPVAKFSTGGVADLLAHVFQLEWSAVGMTIDGVNFPATGDPGVTTVAQDIVCIGNANPQYGPGNAGFCNIGCVVMSYTQPSSEEVAEVLAWVNAYGA